MRVSCLNILVSDRRLRLRPFRLAAELTTRFGARNTLLTGLTLILAGLVLFTRAPIDASYVRDVLPSMLLPSWRAVDPKRFGARQTTLLRLAEVKDLAKVLCEYRKELWGKAPRIEVMDA